jgi:hypothetical protein
MLDIETGAVVFTKSACKHLLLNNALLLINGSMESSSDIKCGDSTVAAILKLSFGLSLNNLVVAVK